MGGSKTIKICSLGLIGLMGILFAPPVGAQSLSDALASVYESNPNIQAERKRFRALSEVNNQAWAAALPQISANGAFSRIDQNQTVNSNVFGQATQSTRNFKLNSKTYAISGEQPLFTGLRNFNSIKQANARVRAGAAQLIAFEQQTLRDTVAAYFDVVRDMAVYNANTSNVAVLLSQRKDAEVRFELGAVTKTDILQAEARLAGARTQLAGAKTQLTVSRARFKELVGYAPSGLQADPPLPVLPESEEEAQTMAFHNAPVMIAIREEEEASRRQYNIERSAFLPSVSFTASYLYADEASSFVDEDEQFAYGVRATVPLFLGGLRFSKTRQAKALNERDRSRIVATDRQVSVQVTSVWEQLFEAHLRIESAQAQVDANQLALDGVRREAQLGMRSTLDVLNAEQEFLNSTVALASAKRDEQVAAYALLAAIGALSPDAAPSTDLSGNHNSDSHVGYINEPSVSTEE